MEMNRKIKDSYELSLVHKLTISARIEKRSDERVVVLVLIWFRSETRKELYENPMSFGSDLK